MQIYRILYWRRISNVRYLLIQLLPRTEEEQQTIDDDLWKLLKLHGNLQLG